MTDPLSPRDPLHDPSASPRQAPDASPQQAPAFRPPVDPSAFPSPGAPQPPPDGPPRALVRSPLSDGEWHRLHPLTPLLRGGLFLIVIVGIIVSNLRDRLLYLFIPSLAPEIPPGEIENWEGSGDPIDYIVAHNLYLLALLVVLGVLLILIGIFYMSWRFHTLRITGDDVEVRSGILFRTQRRAPLDRVQGVNLTRPMVARLFGMAKLEVVGAGADANVKLEYLSTSNAEAVRADILRLASGRRLADAAARAGEPGARPSRVAALGQTVSRGLTGLIDGDEPAVEVPDSVVHIPVGRLIASHIISPGTVGLVLAAIAIGIGVSQGVTWLLFAFVPTLIGFGAYWVRSITKSLRYSIAPTPDGVRITFGLLTTVTEVVPPGRIHAVEITQPILWRPAGWWAIRINRLSGRSASDSNRDQFTTALPVGTAADVERVLRLMLPAVPEAEWPLIVHEGMFRSSGADTFTTTPRRAWIVRPLSWRRNGFRLAQDALLLRRGLIWRKLSILPLARLQSIAVHQGPVDRMLRIASARGDVVAGPVWTQLAAIDRDASVQLFADVARATIRASSDDRTHRWAADDGADLRAEGPADPRPEEPAAVEAGQYRPDIAVEPGAERLVMNRDGRLGVGIIGAGRVGPVIGSALAAAGHALIGITHGSDDARVEAMLPGVPILDPLEVVRRSELVVIAVPHDQLEGLVTGLAEVGAWQSSQLVMHTDPAFGTGVLAAAAAMGVIPLAVHPAIAFTGTSIDRRQLVNAYAAVTAPAPVLPIAQALAVELGCEPIVIAEDDRAAYAEGIATATEFSRSIVRQAAALLRQAGVPNPGAYLSALAHSTIDHALADAGSAAPGLPPATIDG